MKLSPDCILPGQFQIFYRSVTRRRGGLGIQVPFLGRKAEKTSIIALKLSAQTSFGFLVNDIDGSVSWQHGSECLVNTRMTKLTMWTVFLVQFSPQYSFSSTSATGSFTCWSSTIMLQSTRLPEWHYQPSFWKWTFIRLSDWFVKRFFELLSHKICQPTKLSVEFEWLLVISNWV